MKSKKLIFGVVVLLLFQFKVLCQNKPPVLTASGDQVYCPLSQIPVVTSFNITDEDDTTVEFFSIQISSNYDSNRDILRLIGSHPNIVSTWDDREGKLTLNGIGGSSISHSDLINSVNQVVFESTNPNISGEKLFSLTIGNANYLPSTQHYYEFIPNVGISWSQAKTLAENRTYFGLRGYLTTITSLDEANFVGEQSSGAGWIGGTDEETEGVWKWATGPEMGTVFWNGNASGSSPNFAFWNKDEPNNFNGNEDYAHITDDSVGTIGSWNDLPLNGDTGVYEPKGYIVEYGGWPDDPVLNISAITRIYLPEITTISEGSTCGSGSVTLSATSSGGTILWYDSAFGGNLMGTGNNFTTPVLNTSQSFYVTTTVSGCTSSSRIDVLATVNTLPTITSTEDGFVCGNSGTVILKATPSEGTVRWYDSISSTTPVFVGNNYEVTISSNMDYFVEALNSKGCVSSGRTTVSATVNNAVPDFDIEERNILCLNTGSLELLITNPSSANNVYNWTDEEGNSISSLETASITKSGIYFVQATSTFGCKSEIKEIEVIESEIASIKIEQMFITDDSDNNSILVNNENLGTGTYEFSLDNINYQDDGSFQNLQPGIYSLYIRDKKGCGTAIFEFSVFNYPSFFTPNNDGVKDKWFVEGYNRQEYTSSKVQIFNRFGKLLYQTSESSQNWDGTYNGNILPSDTYWFLIEVTDKSGRIIQKRGPLSLLRK